MANKQGGDRAQPRVVFVANSDWYLYNFRSALIQRVEDAGWDVTLICTDGPYLPKLKERGWRVIALPLESAGVNPLREAKAFVKLALTLRAERPSVVHLFTLKCVLYGCLSAPVVPYAQFIGAITGMGSIFTTKTLKNRLLRPLVRQGLRLGLRQSKAELIFQNDFDRNEFVEAGVVQVGKAHTIRGSGVDCIQFHPDNHVPSTSGRLRLLFCGRLIAEKGIREYLDATAQLRHERYDFESRIAGDPYPGNPSSLSPNEIDQLRLSDTHTYLGHCDDMRELLGATDIVVLPTYYREGTPKVLLEAAASGCIIVATDIPGCAGIVEPGLNGYLVAPRQTPRLIDAIRLVLTSTNTERQMMAKHSRNIAVSHFSEQFVNSKTMAIYKHKRLAAGPRFPG